MYMVLDPDGVIVRVIETEAGFEEARDSHLMAKLQEEIPPGPDKETTRFLRYERARALLSQYKMVCL
jgi:hypothetical protein